MVEHLLSLVCMRVEGFTVFGVLERELVFPSIKNGNAHSNNLFFGLMMEALGAMQDIMSTQ